MSKACSSFPPNPQISSSGGYDLFAASHIEVDRRQQQTRGVAFQRLKDHEIGAMEGNDGAIEPLRGIAVHLSEMLRQERHQQGRKRIPEQDHASISARISSHEMATIDLNFILFR